MKLRTILSITLILVLALSFSGIAYAEDVDSVQPLESEVQESGEEPTGDPSGEFEEPSSEEIYTEPTDYPSNGAVPLPSQTIETERDNYDGIIGETDVLRATAEGTITYSSSDKTIVKIGKTSGKMTFLKKGKITITIKAAATEEYARTTKTIRVVSYPKKLGKSDVTIKKLGNTRVTITWKKNRFATNYRLIKYNLAKSKYELVKLYDKSVTEATFTRDAGKYAIRPIAVVHGKTIKAKELDPIKVKSLALYAKTYKKAKNIRTYTPSNLNLVANIRGVEGTRVPQSLSFTGDKYIISYVNKEGTKGHLVSYSRNGKVLATGPLVKIGHANGATYNPNRDTIYTVKTHSNYYSKVCTTLSPDTLKKTDAFNLPKITSGIAYDESNNRYYLSKGNEIYVTDSKFRYKKTIKKKIRSYHAQDIGAYNGVALVCTWVSGKTSYVDLYRIKDGAYLGSYTFFFNEIESVVVDDGYLVVIMNHVGDNIDYLYKTKERITVNL